MEQHPESPGTEEEPGTPLAPGRSDVRRDRTNPPRESRKGTSLFPRLRWDDLRVDPGDTDPGSPFSGWTSPAPECFRHESTAVRWAPGRLYPKSSESQRDPSDRRLGGPTRPTPHRDGPRTVTIPRSLPRPHQTQPLERKILTWSGDDGEGGAPGPGGRVVRENPATEDEKKSSLWGTGRNRDRAPNTPLVFRGGDTWTPRVGPFRCTTDRPIILRVKTVDNFAQNSTGSYGVPTWIVPGVPDGWRVSGPDGAKRRQTRLGPTDTGAR